jgi:hypothetical protein
MRSDMDEASMGYKDIHAVMAAQHYLVKYWRGLSRDCTDGGREREAGGLSFS